MKFAFAILYIANLELKKQLMHFLRVVDSQWMETPLKNGGLIINFSCFAPETVLSLYALTQVEIMNPCC